MSGFLSWLCVFYVFFFKQKTAYEMRISDWSSDVCSSDLFGLDAFAGQLFIHVVGAKGHDVVKYALDTYADGPAADDADGGSTLSCTQIGRASCRERVCQYV